MYFLAGQMLSHLYAVTADSLVAGAGEETYRHVRDGRHQQTVDFVGVTFKHSLALPALDPREQNTVYILESPILYILCASILH